MGIIMDIFYLKKSEFLENIDYKTLQTFSDNREFNSKEKEEEHLLGLFLTKFIAKHIYDIENTEIELKNKKPFFKFAKLHFSISHSNDIVLVVFNNSNIGADVEYMDKHKNFKQILNRYGNKTTNPTVQEFYRFWTGREAEIKLGNSNIKSLFSEILEIEYMLTCVSDNIFVSNFQIKKLNIYKTNTDLNKELNFPQNIKCDIIA